MSHSNHSQPMLLRCGKIVSIYVYMFGLYIPWFTVIQLLSGGLLTLIADQPLPSAVKDVVDAVQIPVVSTSIITTDTDSTIVSVAPSEEQLANALSTLIINNSWTDVVLLTWHGSSMYVCMYMYGL